MFNVPPTAQYVIWRRGHDLKSRTADWRSLGSNSGPLGSGYKAKRDDYIHGYLHLIVEYRLSPLTIMGRMGKTTRVENRGETTTGERTRGKHLGGETSCYRYGLDPQSLNCCWGPACSWLKMCLYPCYPSTPSLILQSI